MPQSPPSPILFCLENSNIRSIIQNSTAPVLLTELGPGYLPPVSLIQHCYFNKLSSVEQNFVKLVMGWVGKEFMQWTIHVVSHNCYWKGLVGGVRSRKWKSVHNQLQNPDSQWQWDMFHTDLGNAEFSKAGNMVWGSREQRSQIGS